MSETNYRGWYRAEKGILFGVCEGSAEIIGMNPLLLRAMVIVAGCITGVVPILIGYTLAALLLPVKGTEGRRYTRKTRPSNKWEAKWDEYYN